ncbi:MAG TPA: FAD:protein FMN transferase [Burkholderiaceae bacterium]|nr:FAD:protein FMN transferase [Burkholderiaceae bacterium]
MHAPEHAHPVDRRRRTLAAGLGLLAIGPFLRPALADPQVRREARVLMGTRVDIVAQGRDPALTAAAIAAAFAEMARLERLMSRFRADSQVSALNRGAGRHAIEPAPEVLAVLRQAREVAARSGGAFDVTVGAYAGWSFAGGERRVPGDAQLAHERLLVDHRDLVIDDPPGRAMLRRAGMRMDLGGIAKLPILQAGMATLQRHGMHDAMINGGGDVFVNGRLQGRPWRIGLRDPLRPDRLMARMSLTGGIVAASGDYERCFEHEGRRYHHVLDPRTGRPSTGVHGVVLVSDRLEEINGLGTAIMVAGTQAGRRLLASLPGVDALIVDDAPRPWVSTGMAHRLQGTAAA